MKIGVTASCSTAPQNLVKFPAIVKLRILIRLRRRPLRPQRAPSAVAAVGMSPTGRLPDVAPSRSNGPTSRPLLIISRLTIK
jgi:hypothetical protein